MLQSLNYILCSLQTYINLKSVRSEVASDTSEIGDVKVRTESVVRYVKVRIEVRAP